MFMRRHRTRRAEVFAHLRDVFTGTCKVINSELSSVLTSGADGRNTGRTYAPKQQPPCPHLPNIP